MILSICSQKGGTGKTTTTISIAAALSLQGKKVLLIDVDPQANSSKVLLGNDYPQITREESVYQTILERHPLPIHKTYRENLDISPGHILLSDTDIKLTTAIDHREARLKTYLDSIKDQYDHVLIDCPPSLSWLTINAFTASDLVLIVVSPGYFELDSTTQILKTISDVKQNFNAGLRVAGFLYTMSDSTIASRTSLSILRQTYPTQVLNTIISRNTDVREAHMNKTDIFMHSPECKAANDYSRLITELFK